MSEVQRIGVRAALERSLAIAAEGTDAFGISIDLDAVTPEEAPGVGTPVDAGLSAAGLTEALAGIGGRPGLAAVELVEYSPRRDPDRRTARVAVDLLAAALCGSQQ
jgi:arginase